MQINNIEFSYSKKCIPLKIQYMEKRFPTYIEFLVLCIINGYPDKELELRKVLENDFNVKNQILFDKAINELILLKNISIKSDNYQWNKKNVDYKISDFIIHESIKRSIERNEHAQTLNNKADNVKLFYDDILNTYSILRESDWDKKISGAKYFYKFQTNVNGLNLNVSDLRRECDLLMRMDTKNFSKEDTLENILDSKNEPITDGAYLNFESVEQRAIELSLNYDENRNYINVTCGDRIINERLNNNEQLKLHLLLNVLSSYIEKSKEKILPIDINIIKSLGYKFNGYDLIDEIQVGIDQDVCMVNGRYINIFKKLIDDQRLFSNVKYIIVYNSKVNSQTIDRYEDKVIFNIGQINSKELMASSLIFFDGKNAPTSYIVTEKILFNKLSVPIIVKNDAFAFSIKDILTLGEGTFKNEFLKCINNLDVKGVESIISISKRFDVLKQIEEIIINYVNSIVTNPSIYNSLITKFEENNCQSSIRIFEKSLLKAINNVSKNIDNDSIISMIKSFKYINNKNISLIIDYLKIKWTWKQVNTFSLFLEQNGIDPWKNNTGNCLVRMIEFYMLNQKSGLFLENEFKSYTYKIHVKFLESHCKLIKYIYQNNYAKARIAYSALMDEYVNLMNESLEKITDKTEYLSLLNNIFTTVYKNISSQNYENYYLSVTFDQAVLSTYRNTKNYINNLDKFLSEKLGVADPNSICIELKMEFYKIKFASSQEVIDFYDEGFLKMISGLKIIYGSK